MYTMSNMHNPWFFILMHQLFICFLILSVLCSCRASKLSYDPHCKSMVPVPALYKHNTVSGLSAKNSLNISLYHTNAYLSVQNSSKIFHNLTLPAFLSVSQPRLLPTKNDVGFKVLDATLEFRNELESKDVYFSMSGYYSKVTGKSCMVGTGIDRSTNGKPLPLYAVVKLYYPITSSISSCVVRGTIESLNESRSISHFDRISIQEYFDVGYVFTKIPQVKDICLVAEESHESESVAMDSSEFCNYFQIRPNMIFVLECDKIGSASCGAFSKLMYASHVQCMDDGKVNLLISFANTTNGKVNRNQYFIDSFDFSYIYAYPEGGFFSSFMDTFVPSIGAILVAIMCLQQKLGSDFFLPQSLRRCNIHGSVLSLQIETDIV